MQLGMADWHKTVLHATKERDETLVGGQKQTLLKTQFSEFDQIFKFTLLVYVLYYVQAPINYYD